MDAGTDKTGQLSTSTGTVSLNFEGTASDSDGTIASVEWNFGDGSSANSAEASHTYTSAGVYTATFTATDNDGDSSSDSIMVTIVEADQNNPPIAVITLTPEMPVSVGATVTISGANSSDADGNELTYSWILLTPTNKILLGTAETFEYDFDEVGTFELVLIVSDGELKDDAVAKIMVEGAQSGTITIPIEADISVNTLKTSDFYNELTNPIGNSSLKLTKNMVAIHKFDLSIENLDKYKMPKGAKIKSAIFIGTITSIDSSELLTMKQAIKAMPTVGTWSEEKGVTQKVFLDPDYTVDSVTIGRMGTYKWDVTKLISILYEDPEKFSGIALVPATKAEIMYFMGSSENRSDSPSLVINWVL